VDPYAFDRSLKGTPLSVIAGVDEVGRGPLAGPVVASAVILPETPVIDGLEDSKLLLAEQREALYFDIAESAISWSVSVVTHEIIDVTNILAASLQAMREAAAGLSPRPNLLLVDGNQKPKSGIAESPIVKGDRLSASIMAASIVAKVTRDDLMREMHKKYPEYGFDENKGYGSRKHLEALQKYGPCAIHRKSFEPVKSMPSVIPTKVGIQRLLI